MPDDTAAAPAATATAAAAAAAAAAAQLSPGRATLIYSAGRLGIFLVLAVLLNFAFGFFVALVGAALVSAVVSYFALARWRLAMAAGVEARVLASRQRSAARAAREDEAAEALIREQQLAGQRGLAGEPGAAE